MVHAGVCMVILMWTCLVGAERSTPDNFRCQATAMDGEPRYTNSSVARDDSSVAKDHSSVARDEQSQTRRQRTLIMCLMTAVDMATKPLTSDILQSLPHDSQTGHN